MHGRPPPGAAPYILVIGGTADFLHLIRNLLQQRFNFTTDFVLNAMPSLPRWTRIP